MPRRDSPKVPVVMATPDGKLEARTRARLSDLESRGLKRSLEEPAGIDLCSNDYLAFAQHPRIRRRFAEAAERLGAGSTGSRLLRGHRAAFRLVEERFARLKNTQAALFFGSGWAANLGVLSTFPRQEDVVFSDELNHASLIDGMKLSKAKRVVFPHCDQTALARLIGNEPCKGQRFVVTESLFSMDGDRAPLASYAELRKRCNFALIVDEAHAVGVYGQQGSGLIEHTGCEDSVFLSINSAGKALGVSGAFVCGPAWATDYLIQAARSFVYSTAPPPAVAEALSESLDMLPETASERLAIRALGADLRNRLNMRMASSPIVPVIIGDSEKAVEISRRLREQGFDVRAVRPPTVPKGTARLRISINASVTSDDVLKLSAYLREILEEFGLWPVYS